MDEVTGLSTGIPLQVSCSEPTDPPHLFPIWVALAAVRSSVMHTQYIGGVASQSNAASCG